MTPQDAWNLIVNALEHAQGRGAFAIQDSVNIANAINVLLPLLPVEQTVSAEAEKATESK